MPRTNSRAAVRATCLKAVEPTTSSSTDFCGFCAFGCFGLERRLRPDVVHLNGYTHGALPWRAPVLVVGHSCVLGKVRIDVNGIVVAGSAGIKRERDPCNRFCRECWQHVAHPDVVESGQVHGFAVSAFMRTTTTRRISATCSPN